MERIAEWTNDDPAAVPLEPSHESLAPILAALVGGGPVTVQPATLPNAGQVPGLPLGSSVETLATFAGGLVSPHAGGQLPGPAHALVQKHCRNQDLIDELLQANAALLPQFFPKAKAVGARRRKLAPVA